jgi:hypothetical protein
MDAMTVDAVATHLPANRQRRRPRSGHRPQDARRPRTRRASKSHGGERETGDRRKNLSRTSASRIGARSLLRQTFLSRAAPCSAPIAERRRLQVLLQVESIRATAKASFPRRALRAGRHGAIVRRAAEASCAGRRRRRAEPSLAAVTIDGAQHALPQRVAGEQRCARCHEIWPGSEDVNDLHHTALPGFRDCIVARRAGCDR